MGGRFDVFHALDADKQQRIIKAALMEFATQGFKRASTNTIANEAKIGKVMLCYYFCSKEELYNFLWEYAIEYIRSEFIQGFKTDSRDFLKRYRLFVDIKHKATFAFPEVVAFFENVYLEDNEKLLTKLNSEIQETRHLINDAIYKDLDYSLFREDIDEERVIAYLQWLFDGYEKDITARFKNGSIDVTDDAEYTEEWEMFYSFMDDLRHLFYKVNKEE